MRPRRLVIQNFGPFHGPPTAIDFDRFDRLFLVAGDTGAGKTTIFDAICFALYGQPLGTRDAPALRSHRASEDEPTSVELVFTLRDRRFKVCRAPEYSRRKQRGEGTTQAKASVELYRDEHGTFVPIAAKPSEINARIAREIGLSYSEFSRVLVLPQGEFQQFLEMSSKDRGTLLERLFPVDRHRAVMAVAKAESARAIDELARRARELDSLVASGFDPSNVDAARAAIESERDAAEHAFAEAERIWLETTLERDRAATLAARFVEYDAALRSRAESEERAARIDDSRRAITSSRAARRVLETIARRDAAAKYLRESSDRAAEIAKAKEAVAARSTEADGAIARLAEHRDERRRLVEERAARIARATDLRALVDLRTELRALESRSVEISAAIESCRQDITLRQESIHVLELSRSALDALSADRETLLARMRAIESLSGAVRYVRERALRAGEESRASAAARTETEDAKAGLETALAGLRAVEAELGRDRAASIATSLAEGEPCPVCGALEHPSPASPPGDSADLPRARVDAERRVEDARKLLAQCEKAMTTHDALVAERLAREEVETTRFRDAGFESTDAWFERERLAKAELFGIDMKATSIRESLASLPGARAELEKTRARLEEAATRERAEVERKAILQGRLAELEVRAGSFDDAESVLGSERDAIVAIDARVRELDDAVARLEATVLAIDAERARVERETIAVTTRLDEQSRAHGVAERDVAEALVREGFIDEAVVRASVRDAAFDAADERRIAAHDATVIRYRADIDRLEPLVHGVDRPDTSRLEAREAAARESRDRAEVVRSAARNKADSFTRDADRYVRLRAETDAFEAEHRALLTVARDLAGDNQAKLDFPKFALERFLAAVLVQASSRFLRLTRERYSFELDRTVDDARSGAGLDIDVHDAHTGSRRDVKTLSGGEKFMAALSLALGLSDVIEARAGGVALDALFIDEGFGSLDADALDLALTVLDEVGSQRMVGVISHVEAMRSAIPSQLRVERSIDGARVEVA